MRRGLIVKVILIIAILTSLLVGCTSTTSPGGTTNGGGKTAELKINTVFPDMHHVAGSLKWYAGELENRTDGRITATVHTQGGLGTSAEALETLRQGLCDISNFSTYTAAPGVYPLWEVVMLAGLMPNAVSVNYVAWDLYRRGYLSTGPSKIEGIEMMAITGVEELWVWTTEEKVTTLEDYKGLTIDMSGIWRTRAMEKLGIVGQNVPMADRYSSLQRGIVDGTFYGVGMITALKVWEQVKYCQVAPFGQAIIKIGMNQDAFDSLPPDLQVVLMGLNRDFNYLLVDGFLEEQERGYQLCKDNGVPNY